MRVLDYWPMGTAYNCDFVDRTRPVVEPGERIIDLQVDLEDMAPTGILCLHERTVRDMVVLLGWKLEDTSAADRLGDAAVLNQALRDENRALRAALNTIVRKASTVPEVEMVSP